VLLEPFRCPRSSRLSPGVRGLRAFAVGLESVYTVCTVLPRSPLPAAGTSLAGPNALRVSSLRPADLSPLTFVPELALHVEIPGRPSMLCAGLAPCCPHRWPASGLPPPRLRVASVAFRTCFGAALRRTRVLRCVSLLPTRCSVAARPAPCRTQASSSPSSFHAFQADALRARSAAAMSLELPVPATVAACAWLLRLPACFRRSGFRLCCFPVLAV